MEKMAALHQSFTQRDMLKGTVQSHMAGLSTHPDDDTDWEEESLMNTSDFDSGSDGEDEDNITKCPQVNHDVQPTDGDPRSRLENKVSDVKLAARIRAFSPFLSAYKSLQRVMCPPAEPRYPQRLNELASYIKQPQFSAALHRFLYFVDSPSETQIPDCFVQQKFEGKIRVHYSATATFYAPSELCGVGGLLRERIRSTPNFHGGPRRDTVFVELDGDQPGLLGMVIARVLLLFSFHYRRKDHSCALVNWFLRDEDTPDEHTGLWEVRLERDARRQPVVDVIDVDTIVRAAHLLPIYGQSRVPERFSHFRALDTYQSFFVNHFADHHVFELITG